MSEAFKIPPVMDVAEFLDWDAPTQGQWQLLDGEPRAMSPASLPHNSILFELGRRIASHFDAGGSQCRIIPTPGVIPHVRADRNFRIPDLGVTCSPEPLEGYDLPNPILLIEILSPSNQSETWNNVWTYTTIPSVQEILVLRTSSIRADVLRRGPDGSWPREPEAVAGGILTLASIGFEVELSALYRGTRLAVG